MHSHPRPDDDVSALLGRLSAAEAPTQAPAWDEEPAPRSRRPWRWAWLLAPALAVAAAGVVVLRPQPPDGPGLRGHIDDTSIEVDLRLVAIHDGAPQRAVHGDVLQVGDQVLLRVGSAPASEITLWVETPDGPEPLATVTAGLEPSDVELDGQLLAWRFDQPGAYAIAASAQGPERCEPSACTRVEITVRARSTP
jgi:hypothetical protein